MTDQNKSVSEQAELLPCPFCAGTDIRIDEHRGQGRVTGENVYSMCCYDCGATFPNRYRRHLIVESWNRRAPPVLAAAGVIEELREIGQKWMAEEGRDDLEDWIATQSSAKSMVMQPVDKRAHIEGMERAAKICDAHESLYRGASVVSAAIRSAAALSAGPTQAAASGEPWMHHEMYADATQAILSLSRKELEAHFIQARADVSALRRHAPAAEQTATTASAPSADFAAGARIGKPEATDAEIIDAWHRMNPGQNPDASSTPKKDKQ